jgi:hypothetical protein
MVDAFRHGCWMVRLQLLAQILLYGNIERQTGIAGRRLDVCNLEESGDDRE